MHRPLADRPWLASYAAGVPAAPDVPDEPIGAGLVRSAATYPDRVAVDFFGATTTYRELSRAVARAAGALHGLGVRAGDRVAIALPNCTTHVVAFYAVLRLGAVVVEHNPTYGREELAHQLQDSGASVAIAWEQVAEDVCAVASQVGLRAVVAVNLAHDLPTLSRLALHLPVAKARNLRAQLRGPVPADALRWEQLVAHATPLPADHPYPVADDVAALQYTGGTTGVPQGAIITHRNLVANSTQGIAWTQMTPGTETIYGVLPFFHAFGLMLCLTYSIALAATLVVFPKFDPASVLAAQRRRPATFLPAVPPILDRLSSAALASKTDLSSIRYALSGAMALPAATAARWEKATGGLVIEGYGLTETSPVALGNPLSAARRPGALGLPFPSTSMRVVDPEDVSRDVEIGEPGELLVSGPQVFAGYWGRPEETARALVVEPDGVWLRTGDIVEVDESGFAVLVDRIKEVIITGGYNVYPSQVEEHLRGMPGVADVAVVGRRGGPYGETVVAAVVLEKGHGVVDLAAVREWCSKRLARYAVPRELVILAELPRSQIGKVLRRVVRENLHQPSSEHPS